MIPKCCSPRLSSASGSRTRPPLGSYFEKGAKLDPKNLALALGLAGWRPGNGTSIGPRPCCGRR